MRRRDFPTAAAVAEASHGVWYLIRDPAGVGPSIAPYEPVVSRFARDHRLPYGTPSGVGIASILNAARAWCGTLRARGQVSSDIHRASFYCATTYVGSCVPASITDAPAVTLPLPLSTLTVIRAL